MTQKEDLVIIAPKSSRVSHFAEVDTSKDSKKVYSLPPPDIEPYGSDAVGTRLGEDDPAEFLNRLTLQDNLTERERAKTWMRTACLHAKNEEYWQNRANEEFARFERISGRAGKIRFAYYLSCMFFGMAFFEPICWLMAGLAFLFAFIFEILFKKET